MCIRDRGDSEAVGDDPDDNRHRQEGKTSGDVYKRQQRGCSMKGVWRLSRRLQWLRRGGRGGRPTPEAVTEFAGQAGGTQKQRATPIRRRPPLPRSLQ